MSAMPVFAFGSQVCGSLDGEAGGTHREWLVPDGAGGFAMGTVAGLRTRRYHALMVVPDPAAPAPAGRDLTGGGRRVGLVSLDPELTLPSGATVKLATNEWVSGVTAPNGHRLLEFFELADGLPRWRWRIGEVVLERELAMAHGRHSLGVVHRLIAAPAPVRLTLTALCTWRDAHQGRRARGGDLQVTRVADGVLIENAYRLAGPGWRPRGEWWFDAFHREEAARGLDPVEDLWCPGGFTATLAPGETLEVSAWVGDLRRRPARATSLVAAARKRARAVVAAAKPLDAVDAALALAADAFIVRGPDVVAGYPWFGPWARDTMTAYEGLFLHTGRATEGAALLRRQAAALDADPTDWAQDTCDAPLWFVHAVDRHVTGTGDTHLAAELTGPLDRVITGYTEADRPWAARLDKTDGLLALTPADAGTTWMNVRRDGQPLTPRDGKPVELNALWINALAALARLRERRSGDAGALWARHAAAQLSFAKRYAAPTGWLYDVVDAPPAAYPLGGGASNDDPVLRPNQLLAYSLPHAPLDGPEAGAVQAVGRALLTPLGLRTLAPTEYGYHGAHAGPVAARDDAYHQGTAWPWLIGHYVEACRAVGIGSRPGLLRSLEIHLGEWGLGSVSELVDGDAPHRASGAPFSARSVAELIRTRALLNGLAPLARAPGS